VLDRDAIARLIPHQGQMSLLDAALAWDDGQIACRATSHLCPANPLRRAGRLGMVCGVEYCLQAAALHGALALGARAREGRLAALRDVTVAAGRLDDPAHGALAVTALLEAADRVGMIYRFSLAAEGQAPASRAKCEPGRALVRGRATIVFAP